MFALVTNSFSATSQTFVRQHAEQIAPGNSVFISYDKTSTIPMGAPQLHWVDRHPTIDSPHPHSKLPKFPKLRLRSHLTADFMRQHGVTTVMAEFGNIGCKVQPAAARAGAALYVHFHGWDASRVLSDPKTVRRYRKLFKSAQGFFAPSQFLADKLIAIGCPENAIWVTPCGVEPDDFPISQRKLGRCLAVGRFVGKKSPLTTVNAFIQAAQNDPTAHLDYVGGGPLLQNCKDIVAAQGLTEKVTFHGEQPHDVVRNLLAECSIFLQHSVTSETGDTEGLPVAILEAMCAGLAIVSTKHSGIPEAVIDQQSGILVAEHDQTAMGHAIATLFADPAVITQFGDAARSRVIQGFTAERTAKILREKMKLG